MWDYSEKVMDHFLNPRNVGEIENPDGTGDVGNMSCGDALKLTFKINDEGIITEAKFKTFGCASAIASSSALTELIIGMTIEEAKNVTNQGIVDVLGELPEEKMHCSVMGMEALQAAIADYRGETIEEADDDHEGRIVCHCFGITDTKIRNVAKANNLKTAAEITNYSKAGGGCGVCLDNIQDILDGVWQEASAEAEAATDAFAGMSIVQKVIKVQEVIDKEIKPILEQDGGSIELFDVAGNVIKVKLKGRCATCPSALVTLEHTVAEKLREFIDPELTVERV